MGLTELDLRWSEDDLRWILEARLWIARLGEGDVLNWWRTDGILGADGAYVGPRVLPKTHRTSRARIAFAVARYTCLKRYHDPAAVHMFRLDPWTEDVLDIYIHQNIGDQHYWSQLVNELENLKGAVDPASELIEHRIVTEEEIDAIQCTPLGPDNRSLHLPQNGSRRGLLQLMAAGFARGQSGSLVVPYVSEQEWRRDD